MDRYIQTIKRTTLKKMKDQYTSPSEFSSDFSESYKKYWDEHKKLKTSVKIIKITGTRQMKLTRKLNA